MQDGGMSALINQIDAMPKSTKFLAYFNTMDGAFSALKRLSFAEVDAKGLSFPSRIRCGVFKLTDGPTVIIGGTLTPNEATETLDTLNKYGKVKIVTTPSGTRGTGASSSHVEPDRSVPSEDENRANDTAYDGSVNLRIRFPGKLMANMGLPMLLDGVAIGTLYLRSGCDVSVRTGVGVHYLQLNTWLRKFALTINVPTPGDYVAVLAFSRWSGKLTLGSLECKGETRDVESPRSHVPEAVPLGPGRGINPPPISPVAIPLSTRGRELVRDLCKQFPFDQVVFMVGNAKIPQVEELVQLGDAAVDACKTGLGRSRCVCRVLSRIGTPKAVSALCGELSSANWQRVQLACESLGWVEHPNVVSALPELERQRNSQFGEVVVAAGEAIKRIKGRFQEKASMPKENIDDLIRNLLPQYHIYRAGIDDNECERCEHAADALGDLRDHRAVGPLLELLNKGEPADLRAAAARALGKIGDPSAADGLAERFLADKNHSTISESAEALVTIALKSAENHARAKLIAVLQDNRVQNHPWLRDDIIRALKEITGTNRGQDCNSWLSWLRSQFEFTSGIASDKDLNESTRNEGPTDKVEEKGPDTPVKPDTSSYAWHNTPEPVGTVDQPFLMPIEAAFSMEGRGTVVTGRVARGVIKAGEEIEIVGLRSTTKTTVTSVEMFLKRLSQGQVGDNIGCLLRDARKEDIERGQVLCKPGSISPHTNFRAEVYFLTKEEGGRHNPIMNGYSPQFYFRMIELTGSITLNEGREKVMPGDNLNLEVELERPIAIEKAQRFVIREDGHTIGVGRVTSMEQSLKKVNKEDGRPRKVQLTSPVAQTANSEPLGEDAVSAFRANPTSVAAIYALAHSSSPEAVEALAELAESSEQLAAVATTLGDIATLNPNLVSKNAKAMSFLINLLKGPGQMSRANAAFALGWTRSRQALEPLRAALQDEDDVVRENAQKAIQQIGG